MKIHQFRFHHLDKIDVQDEQLEDFYLFRLETDKMCTLVTEYPCVSIMDGDICYAIMGQHTAPSDTPEKKVGFVWCFLSKNLKHKMVHFVRFARECIMDNYYDELITYINMRHNAAIRMAKMFGFVDTESDSYAIEHLFKRRREWAV
jgi:hypothetical protein